MEQTHHGLNNPNWGEGICFAKVLSETSSSRIVHFTVVCLVTLPLSGSEAGGDLALIQTFLPFIAPRSVS